MRNRITYNVTPRCIVNIPETRGADSEGQGKRAKIEQRKMQKLHKSIRENPKTSSVTTAPNFAKKNLPHE